MNRFVLLVQSAQGCVSAYPKPFHIRRYEKMKKGLCILLVLLFFSLPDTPLSAGKSNPASLIERIARDYPAIQHSREGLAGTIVFMDTHPELFHKADPKKNQLLTRPQRMAIWQTWQTFLDHMLALDLLGQHYASLQKQKGEIPKNPLFYVTYAIFLAQYRHALDFIRIAERDPDLHTLLNEPVPELGLPRGTYSDLKFEFLNVQKGTEFAWMDFIYSFYGKSPPKALAGGIEEDRKFIWEAGGGIGPALTLKNALKIVQDFSFKAWLPVQANVAEWMGDTRVWRVHQSLITRAQVEAIRPLLKPGDLLLTRREWYLSNIGLPGFWPHSALYIGTPSERREYFEGDLATGIWLKMKGINNGDLEDLLKKRYPDVYRESENVQRGVGFSSVIEAQSEGVLFSSLEVAAAADSLVVLRPRLPRAAKARAILRAFHYIGRPYDFNFDFLTDSELVCTELIYKVYESEYNLAGLDLPLTDILGRKVMTANDLAMFFDRDYGSEKQQFDFVLFLDGHEAEERAFLSNVAKFRESWKRPKWHIVLTENMR